MVRSMHKAKIRSLPGYAEPEAGEDREEREDYQPEHFPEHQEAEDRDPGQRPEGEI